MMRRFGASGSKLPIVIALVLSAACILYIHSLKTNLKQTVEQKEKYKANGESLSAQLQVVYDSKADLQKELEKEKSTHESQIKDAEAAREAQNMRHREEISKMEKELAKEQEDASMLKSKMEDMSSQLEKLEDENKRVSRELEEMRKRDQSDYEKMKQEKDDKITDLKDDLRVMEAKLRKAEAERDDAEQAQRDGKRRFDERPRDDRRVADTDRRMDDTDRRMDDTDRRVVDAGRRVDDAVRRVADADRRVYDAGRAAVDDEYRGRRRRRVRERTDTDDLGENARQAQEQVDAAERRRQDREKRMDEDMEAGRGSIVRHRAGDERVLDGDQHGGRAGENTQDHGIDDKATNVARKKLKASLLVQSKKTGDQPFLNPNNEAVNLQKLTADDQKKAVEPTRKPADEGVGGNPDDDNFQVGAPNQPQDAVGDEHPEGLNDGGQGQVAPPNNDDGVNPAGAGNQVAPPNKDDDNIDVEDNAGEVGGQVGGQVGAPVHHGDDAAVEQIDKSAGDDDQPVVGQVQLPQRQAENAQKKRTTTTTPSGRSMKKTTKKTLKTM